MEVNKRIVIWCGNAPNQKALANKIHKQFGVAAIVIDKKKTGGKKKKQIGFLRKAWDHVRFRLITNAWTNLQQYYETHFTHWPDVPVLEVATINSEEAQEFTKSSNPDLIVVSGTGLVKESFLNLPVDIGIMNLHTGLSPYVKGGPNCTNWCIANNQWELVGNTIMWINAGIDSGNIIVSESLDIRSCSDLNEAHIKVMEHAHDLYLRSIAYLLANEPPYISIQQKELGNGQLLLSKMWTNDKKKQLLRNWKNKKTAILSFRPKTISLPVDGNEYKN